MPELGLELGGNGQSGGVILRGLQARAAGQLLQCFRGLVGVPVELVDEGVGLGNDGVHARIYFNLRGTGLKSSVGTPKPGVGGFQCFLGTDIQPIAGDGPGVSGPCRRLGGRGTLAPSSS